MELAQFKSTQGSSNKLDNPNELRRKITQLETQICRLENEKISITKKNDKEKVFLLALMFFLGRNGNAS